MIIKILYIEETRGRRASGPPIVPMGWGTGAALGAYFGGFGGRGGYFYIIRCDFVPPHIYFTYIMQYIYVIIYMSYINPGIIDAI